MYSKDNEALDNGVGKTPTEIQQELNLPADRPLSYEEALSLRASNINFMHEDENKLTLLEQYAKDPKEINAKYVWAVYQTWHEQEQDVKNLGYQTIFKLAERGYPYACADVYVWSVNFSDEFFRNDLKVDKKEILEIQDFCFEKALEINANEIKQFYIKKFLFSYGDDDDEYDKLSPQLMKNADKARLNRVKEYLLDYLFYWTNDFYGDVPANNLADTDKAYQYLQILAYDPYSFDAVEACAWLKYFQGDILPFIQKNQLAALSTRKDSLNNTINFIERKLKNEEFDQQQCQNRYLEIRDTPRDSEAKSRNFY
ncbi:hypothetical protein [Psychrobacter sp. DAB_AL43B]|uniref:hypothetical protein n=1 Tax=Psychrobacter sp. DAB_AL43B TaxID=1028416 RepID=UPI0011AB807F|nr:hypothetical protein [Psychrobacter sp. DAB_AL43B]